MDLGSLKASCRCDKKTEARWDVEMLPVMAERPAKVHKGQKARSGGKVRAGFEGGQMPMARRLAQTGLP
jgi:hypothetical protein